ncbi:hypothetical protein K503DRAFT_169133 [Rhizopogon vinicolor AM-OR11-026]|uniref:Thioesterase domain-containing protein n=1 Tax=Rhizopogon vinicolor AM-OR11-026 TaxID=1314800 RepID=A0A1B7NF40_9AGAM|nr:hypothetical protein K503DRAFT_169133 [Rhizopogon vinicolor AM-OR11-026]
MMGDTDISQVEGNTSPEIKRAMLARVQYLATGHVTQSTGEQFGTFESKIASRLRLIEVSILPKAEEPEKLEGRVVFEVIVDEEMANYIGPLHGGVAAILIDDCSSMPFYLIGLATSGHVTTYVYVLVSQSLNIVYHSPALLGDKLRVVSTTLTVGNRMLSSRCEVWNTTRHKLVASAVHVKMNPSEQKATSAKL